MAISNKSLKGAEFVPEQRYNGSGEPKHGINKK